MPGRAPPLPLIGIGTDPEIFAAASVEKMKLRPLWAFKHSTNAVSGRRGAVSSRTGAVSGRRDMVNGRTGAVSGRRDTVNGGRSAANLLRGAANLP